ncbi:hypothetical protein D3C78_992810 [compost metagenome]
MLDNVPNGWNLQAIAYLFFLGARRLPIRSILGDRYTPTINPDDNHTFIGLVLDLGCNIC